MGQPNIIKQLDVYVHAEVFGCPQRICVCQDFWYSTSLSFIKYFLIEWVWLADALYSK